MIFFFGGGGGGGWCARCRNLSNRQHTHCPQFCAHDVDGRFCGGGAWISWSELLRYCQHPSSSWLQMCATRISCACGLVSHSLDNILHHEKPLVHLRLYMQVKANKLTIAQAWLRQMIGTHQDRECTQRLIPRKSAPRRNAWFRRSSQESVSQTWAEIGEKLSGRSRHREDMAKLPSPTQSWKLSL